MPNIQSAKKRVKVSEKKNLRNRMVKSGVKTSVRKLAEEGTVEQYAATTSAIDKAVAKGIIHKNAANRKKARLAKMVKA
ncbi:MAG: 30S ribosomal protein S20 [Clostridia bacterium]|nr:30S ribosomal protein S20 [Clostridia bacterium]